MVGEEGEKGVTVSGVLWVWSTEPGNSPLQCNLQRPLGRGKAAGGGQGKRQCERHGVNHDQASNQIVKGME